MNKITFKKENLFFTRINIFIVFLFLFTLYSMQLTKISKEETGINVYDFFIQLTDYLTFSYMIVPLFLVILTTYFFTGDITNYLTFRFKTKYSWYVYYLKFILKISCFFLFLILVIMVFQSIYMFSLSDFANTWSLYSENYYAYFKASLRKISPLFYISFSFLLMFLQLWVLGLMFLNFFILLKNSIFSFIFTYAVYLLNLIVIVNKMKIITHIHSIFILISLIIYI